MTKKYVVINVSEAEHEYVKKTAKQEKMSVASLMKRLFAEKYGKPSDSSDCNQEVEVAEGEQQEEVVGE